MSTAQSVTHPERSGSLPALDALVVAPHPDDAELGMGGTIAAPDSARVEGRDPGLDGRRADSAGHARASRG